METSIQHHLSVIERKYRVRIIYACESGSRAWGFASTDSDFDIRFLYLRPQSWYLSIDLEHRSSVLEWPPDGVWDIVGWDLRKALRLMRHSNPQLLEWLHSPIVYRDVETTGEQLRALLPQVHSPERAMHHYLRMAARNRRVSLEKESIQLKKYFDVLRPLLACRWIEAGRGMVPVEFDRLLEAGSIDPPLLEHIQELLDAKRSGQLGLGSRLPAIDRFIEGELQRLEGASPGVPKSAAPIEPLNQLFRDFLDRTPL